MLGRKAWFFSISVRLVNLYKLIEELMFAICGNIIFLDEKPSELSDCTYMEVNQNE